jgi:hypothetical protein
MVVAVFVFYKYLFLKNKFGELKNFSTILQYQIIKKMQRNILHIEQKNWFSSPLGDYTICGAFYVDL